MTMPLWVWVKDKASAEKARKSLARTTMIAIDTEYDSFRYFREKLCLLQIRSGRTTYLFDPLVPLDFSFIGDAFASPDILKVMHAGDNDIRILRRDYDFTFANIFDTYRAASLLGSETLSLAGLVSNVLKVDFTKHKKVQRSQWENRPLSDVQLQYAVEDTVYLIPLYRVLKKALETRGLMGEALRIFGDIAGATWQERRFDKHGHERLTGFAEMTERHQARLKALYRWRFKKAAEINRAVFMVLSDAELLGLVAARVRTPQQLGDAGVLSGDKLSRYGKDLLAILQA